MIFKCVSFGSLVLNVVIDAANHVDVEVLLQIGINGAVSNSLIIHLKLLLKALGNLRLLTTSYLLYLLGSRAHFER